MWYLLDTSFVQTFVIFWPKNIVSGNSLKENIKSVWAETSGYWQRNLSQIYPPWYTLDVARIKLISNLVMGRWSFLTPILLTLSILLEDFECFGGGVNGKTWLGKVSSILLSSKASKLEVSLSKTFLGTSATGQVDSSQLSVCSSFCSLGRFSWNNLESRQLILGTFKGE